MKPNNNHLFSAIKAADNVFDYRFKHGAVIYDKHGNIISTGFNKKRSIASMGPYGYYYCWLHAESDAILKALNKGYSLKGCSILVIRSGNTKLCNSKPCVHCLSLLLESGINVKDIWYSNSDGTLEQISLNN